MTPAPRQLWLTFDPAAPEAALGVVAAFVRSARPRDPVELALACGRAEELEASTRLIGAMREDPDLVARWDRLPDIAVHAGDVPAGVAPGDRLDGDPARAGGILRELREALAPYVSVTPVLDRVDWARAWRPEPGFAALAVDNRSEDGTAEALEARGAGVVVNERRLGRVANWRAAMEAFRDRTDRPWMKWLFAGDELDPGAADALDAALARYPEARLITGAYYIRTANGQQLWRTLPETRLVQPDESLFISTVHNWFGGPIGQAVHRDVVDEIEFGTQPWVADWQSFLSVAQDHPVLYVAEPMGVFDVTQRKFFLEHNESVGSLVQELSMRFQALDKLRARLPGPDVDRLEGELHADAARALAKRVEASRRARRSGPSPPPRPRRDRELGALGAVLERMAPVRAALERVDEPAAIDDLDKSHRLPDKAYPRSCTDEEGLVLYDVIAANGLREGFEVATAFGYSTAFIGLALEATGGRLVSMDCYVEEWKESFSYEAGELAQAVGEVRASMARGVPPRGYAFATEQLRALGLEERVELAVGVSPQDVPAALGSRTLDFALVDGGHFGDQPKEDFEAIAGRLADRCAVFFHDNHDNPAVARAVAAAEAALGSPARVLPTRYRLTLVSRGLDPGGLDAIDRLLARSNGARRR